MKKTPPISPRRGNNFVLNFDAQCRTLGGEFDGKGWNFADCPGPGGKLLYLASTPEGWIHMRTLTPDGELLFWSNPSGVTLVHQKTGTTVSIAHHVEIAPGVNLRNDTNVWFGEDGWQGAESTPNSPLDLARDRILTDGARWLRYFSHPRNGKKGFPLGLLSSTLAEHLGKAADFIDGAARHQANRPRSPFMALSIVGKHIKTYVTAHAGPSATRDR